jgi:hypothetical protein
VRLRAQGAEDGEAVRSPSTETLVTVPCSMPMARMRRSPNRPREDREAKKKAIERLHFEAFRENIAELQGRPATAAEPPAPDFVVTTATGKVGIELTSVQTSRREQEELRGRAVRLGQEKYEQLGRPSVLVAFHWSEALLRDENMGMEELAHELARLIESHVPASESGRENIEWRELRAVGLERLRHEVHVVRIPNVRTAWTSPDGGYLSSELEVVTQLLGEKEAKLTGYRESCDEVWLLMVSEEMSISRTLHVEKLMEHELASNFDRIYLLEFLRKRVHRFRQRPK